MSFLSPRTLWIPQDPFPLPPLSSATAFQRSHRRSPGHAPLLRLSSTPRPLSSQVSPLPCPSFSLPVEALPLSHPGPARRRRPKHTAVGWGIPDTRLLGPPGRYRPRDSLRGDKSTVRRVRVPSVLPLTPPSRAHREAPPPSRRSCSRRAQRNQRWCISAARAQPDSPARQISLGKEMYCAHA